LYFTAFSLLTDDTLTSLAKRSNSLLRPPGFAEQRPDALQHVAPGYKQPQGRPAWGTSLGALLTFPTLRVHPERLEFRATAPAPTPDRAALPDLRGFSSPAGAKGLELSVIES